MILESAGVLWIAGMAGVLIFLFIVAWTDAHTAHIPDALLLAGIPILLFCVEIMKGSFRLPEMQVVCMATGEVGQAHLYFSAIAEEFSRIGPWQRLLGMAGVSGLLLCLSLLRPGAFGGGDVKLAALTGFLLGWQQSWYAFAVSVFSAGVYVLWKLLRKEAHRNSQIPFGPFLCLGTAWILLFHMK